jgi:dipeptidyl aminopeptidase/acylaminoacyl peptidase
LDSFRFSPEAAVPAAIPDPLWQEAVAGCSQSQAPTGDQAPLTSVSLLFARHDDLWQADLDGNHERQLTQGGFLKWGMEDEAGDWFQAYLYRPPQAAPNGRYLIHSQTGRDLLLLDLAGDPATPEALPRPGAPRVAWSPDSRYLAYAPDAGLPAHQAGLYLYDLESGAAQSLLSAAEASDVAEIVWSPDGRFLAFACCYAPAEAGENGTAVQQGLIRRLEVATGALETVAETTRSVGGGTARLCWTSDGAVVEERDVAPDTTARCSYERPGQIARSRHGRFQATLAPLSPEDHFWRGPSRLSVTHTETGEVQWQLDLEIPATRVFWSPDDRWLFLDSRAQARYPIWRLPAAGDGEPEPIVESGFLLEIMAPD